MKATEKQKKYINDLYKGVYTEAQMDMLTTKSASRLISALRLWCRPRQRITNDYIYIVFNNLLAAEYEAFGVHVSEGAFNF